MCKKGKVLQRELLLLEKKGWTPDLIIGHSGWGCGIHVKEIWPNSKFISYNEWWFKPDSKFIEHANKHCEGLNSMKN